MPDLSSVYSSGSLEINGLPNGDIRKITKLRIFLNSKNIVYELNGNKLAISFMNKDDKTPVVLSSKIISFIEKLFNTSVSIDQSLSAKLNEMESENERFDLATEKLKYLKEKGLSEDDNFRSFKALCDKTLVCHLRPYQYEAAYFLTLGNGGFDFSVPGSGKTIISYAAYNYFRKSKVCDYILIIGPINSYNAWHDEYETCFGQTPSFVSLANMSKSEAQIYLLSSKSNHAEITFINIDKVFRLENEIKKFLDGKKCLLIVDEAHKEKNPNAQITKSVLEISKYVNSRIVLTGTPMPNGYEDLYTLFKIYSPNQKIIPFNYGDLQRMTKSGADENQQERIMDAIKPYYSRVSKKHLMATHELLPPVFRVVECEMSEKQSEIYDFLNSISYDIENDFESSLNISLIKAVLIRKMQVSANPGLLAKSIVSSIEEYKREYVEQYNEEGTDTEALIRADSYIKEKIAASSIANLIYKFDSGYYQTEKNIKAADLAVSLVSKGEKVIIWDVFVQNMYALKSMIEKRSKAHVEIINGMVRGEERQEAIQNFKKGESQILIANPATLAESISLHRACQNAIYVNRNFNAAQFIQSKDRIHRINMPIGTTATYYLIENKDTVDSEVGQRLKLKENRMLKILDSEELEIGGSEFENGSFMSDDDAIAAYKK